MRPRQIQRRVLLSRPLAETLRQEFALAQRYAPMHRPTHRRSLTFFSRLASLHYRVHEKTVRDAVNGVTWMERAAEVEEEPGLAASVGAMRALDPFGLPWPVLSNE